MWDGVSRCFGIGKKKKRGRRGRVCAEGCQIEDAVVACQWNCFMNVAMLNGRPRKCAMERREEEKKNNVPLFHIAAPMLQTQHMPYTSTDNKNTCVILPRSHRTTCARLPPFLNPFSKTTLTTCARHKQASLQWMDVNSLSSSISARFYCWTSV